MRIHPFGVFLLLLGFCLPLKAQVTAEVILNQEQFLVKESIQAGIRITNRSGQALELGQAGWVEFLITSRDGLLVKKHADPAMEDPFTLESSFMATTRWIDLLPYFDLDERGGYQIQAIIHIDQWKDEVITPARNFEIIRGIPLWKQEFGMPSADSSKPPVMRRYDLLQASYLDELKLYVRLLDARTEEVINVFPISRMVQVSQPQANLDTLNRLHVLNQMGREDFGYFVFTTDGEMIRRETYRIGNVRPRLRGTEQGGVFVAGGLRIAKDSDIPAPKQVVPPPVAEDPSPAEADEPAPDETE